MAGQLLHNLVLFGRLLRGLGLDVSPGRLRDVFHALEHIELGRPADFYFTLRCLLVHDHEQQPLFDAAFERFWRLPAERGTLILPAPARKRRRPAVVPPPLSEPASTEAQGPGADPEAERSPVIEAALTYNAAEALRRKDFADLTPEELAAVQQAIARMGWRLGERRTRRRRPGPGAGLDLRRTLRQNLRYGGEWLRWVRRAPKRQPRPLVILADISGSMERYTRLLLHFTYSLNFGLRQRVETFVFGTRLTRITRPLRNRSVAAALQAVGRAVPDWAGGTRIGDCLKAFNFEWGRRVLGRGAVVLLISDGWDRGDPELVAREMARLKRSCHRVIWLNPLLGMPGYEPLTRGMAAALPYVDDFLPVHTLASLEALAARLASLPER